MPDANEIAVHDKGPDIVGNKASEEIYFCDAPQTSTAYHFFEPSAKAGITMAAACVSLPLLVRAGTNLGELTPDFWNSALQVLQSGLWATGGIMTFAVVFPYGDEDPDEHETIYRHWPHHKEDYEKDDMADEKAHAEIGKVVRDRKISDTRRSELYDLKRIETRKLHREMRLAQKYCAVSARKQTAILAATGSLAATFAGVALYQGYKAVSEFSALLNGGLNMDGDFVNGDQFLSGLANTAIATVLTPLAYAAWTSFANHMERPVIDKNTGMLVPQAEPI